MNRLSQFGDQGLEVGMRVPFIALSASLLLLAACGSSNRPTPDAERDAGFDSGADTSVSDSSSHDSSSGDASPQDASSGDASPQDAGPVCGDGIRSPGEACDTAIAAGALDACPTECPATVSCTEGRVEGASCAARCVFGEISMCLPGDGCCPAGCDTTTDSDCSPSCGNGVVEAPETCDTAITAGTAGACPASCSDGVACTADTLVGSGCSVSCSFSPVTACSDGDGCCPAACNTTTDSDCSPSCGNGVVEAPETCDTAITAGAPGACPSTCDDTLACTTDSLVGAGCSVSCSHAPVTACVDGDGCCPSSCNTTTDADCSPSCGNGIVEAPETCDTAIAAGAPGVCPTSCTDGVACTLDTLVGSGCSASCSFSPVTACSDGDGCCPASCDATTDTDCSPSCGNGVVEAPETCDTSIAPGLSGACPSSCDDTLACTTDSLVGAGCSMSCSYAPVTACIDGDGCCPAGCNAATDGDCSPSCGNGVVEAPEVCDTAISGGAGECPTSCDDMLACTTDSLVGSSCSTACANSPITACIDGDGCCPAACDAVTDVDCGRCVPGAWEIEVVETADHAATGTAIAVDGSDTVHIVYRRRSNLWHAERAAGAIDWTLGGAGGGFPLGPVMDLATTAAGDLHASYYASTPKDLYVASREVGDPYFGSPRVASDYDVGSHNAVTVDAGGTAHVVYYEYAADIGGARLGRPLYRSRPPGGPWSSAELVVFVPANTQAGTHLAIEADAAGAVHVLFRHETDGYFYYARRPVVGTWRDWTSERIATGNDGDLALDPSGGVHVAIERSGTIDHYQRIGTSWTRTRIDGPGLANPTMAVDQGGRVHVAYGDWSGRWSHLKYASRAASGGAFVTETADSTNYVGRHPSLAVDSTGVVHISYQEDSVRSHLRYARRCH